MKFCTSLILAAMVNTATAFSAVAPSNVGNIEPVDKSLKGIDSDESTFDPTTGGNAALTRNNNDEVWVPQVSIMLWRKEYST
jgi:hypothetical protein